jgi:hypothetical protein
MTHWQAQLVEKMLPIRSFYCTTTNFETINNEPPHCTAVIFYRRFGLIYDDHASPPGDIARHRREKAGLPLPEKI